MENDQIQRCSKTVSRSKTLLPGLGRSVSLLFKCNKWHHRWSFSGWFGVSLIIGIIIHSKDAPTGIWGWLIPKSQQSKNQIEIPCVTFNITWAESSRLVRETMCLMSPEPVFILWKWIKELYALRFMNIYEVCVFSLASDLTRCQETTSCSHSSYIIL